jgi:hypothetical protein
MVSRCPNQVEWIRTDHAHIAIRTRYILLYIALELCSARVPPDQSPYIVRYTMPIAALGIPNFLLYR